MPHKPPHSMVLLPGPRRAQLSASLPSRLKWVKHVPQLHPRWGKCSRVRSMGAVSSPGPSSHGTPEQTAGLTSHLQLLVYSR